MERFIPLFIADNFRKSIFSGTIIASVLFADISGFTQLTHTLGNQGREGDEVLSNIINKIFSPSVDLIYKLGGFVASFAGDSFLAIFDNSETPPINVLIACEKLQDHIKDNSSIETKFGIFRISARIGLSFGGVEWGILGSDMHKTYYFKGDAVNGAVASELNCKPSCIVTDHSFFSHVSKYLITEPVMPSYFRIIKTHNLSGFSSAEFVGRRESPDISIYKKFLHPGLLDNIISDELREIVNVFISFKNMDADYCVLQEFISDTIERTYSYGGYFNRVNFGDKGSTLLIGFGIPISYENNIERALKFIHELNNSYFGYIRAGITCGLQFSGIIGSHIRASYDVLGDAVNMASRFAEAAQWGEILVSRNIVEKMTDFYEFNNLGKKKYKGKDKVIETYSLMSSRISGNSISDCDIYGREKEESRMRNIILPLFRGRSGGIVYIYGNPGIGKTSFVEYIARLRSKEAEMCYFMCDSIIRKAWNPIIYFFNSFFNQNHWKKDIDRSKAFEDRHRYFIDKLDNSSDMRAMQIKNELLRTKPMLKAMLGLDTENRIFSELSEKERYENTLYAIKEFCKGLSLVKPVILFFDDVHIIDQDSIEVLRYISGNIEDFPIIFIFASRLGDDGSKPLLFPFRDLHSITLKKISDRSARKLLRKHLHRAPDKELSGYICEKTCNNPFFIEQMCNFLIENKFLKVVKNRFVLKSDISEIPDQISQIVIARIDRLSKEIKELTKIVSVLGRKFEKDIVEDILLKIEHIAGIISDSKRSHFDGSIIKAILNAPLVKYLNEGEKQNIWFTLDKLSYHFKSELIGTVAYNMQLRERLRLVHKISAEAIIGIYSDNEARLRDKYTDIAYHYEKAEIFSYAMEYLVLAADYCKLSYQNKKALELYAKLLEYPVEISKRIKIHISMAGIYELTGDLRNAGMLYSKSLELALKISDEELAVEAKSGLASLYHIQGQYDKAMDIYQEKKLFTQRKKDQKGYAKALGNIAMIHSVLGEYGTALKYYQQKKTISEKIGDKKGLSTAIRNIGYIYLKKGKFSKSKESFLKAIEISLQNKQKKEYGMAIGNLGNLYLIQNKLEDALKCFEEYKSICLEIGDKKGFSLALGNIGYICFQRKDYEKAMKSYETIKNISKDMGNKYAYITAIGNIGSVYLTKGDYNRALDCYNQQKALSEEIKDKKRAAFAIGNIGIIYSYQGMHEKELKCHMEKKKLFESMGDRTETANTLRDIANAYINLKLFSKAMENLDKAARIYKSLGLAHSLCENYITKTEIALKINELKTAKSYSLKASKLIPQINEKELKDRLGFLITRIRDKHI